MPQMRNGLLGHWFATGDGNSQTMNLAGTAALTATGTGGANDHRGTKTGFYCTSGITTSIANAFYDTAIACWIRIDVLSGGVTTTIFGKDSAAAGFTLVMNNTTGALTLSIKGTTSTSAAGVMVTGTWYHVVLSRAGARGLVYVNGSKVIDATFPTSTTGTGGLSVLADAPQFYIDNLRVWVRALDDNEALRLYQDMLGNDYWMCDKLIHYFDFADTVDNTSSVAIANCIGTSYLHADAGRLTPDRFGMPARGVNFTDATGMLSLKVGPEPVSSPIKITSSKFSFSMWARPVVESGEVLQMLLDDSGNFGYLSVADWGYDYPSVGYFISGTWDGEGFYDTGEILTEGWNHLLVTMDGVNHKIYLNGGLISNAETYVNGVNGLGFTRAAYHAPGAYSDVMVWDGKALTPGEVRSLYETTRLRYIYPENRPCDVIGGGQVCL